MLKFGWEIKDICTKLALSRGTVDNLIALSNAPTEIKKQILNNDISDGAVTTILKTHSTRDEQVSLVKEAVENAKQEAVKTGKKAKKATVKHIKSTVKVKTAMQIIEAVVEEIEEEGIKTDMASLFIDVIKGAKAKKSVKSLVKLLND